MNTIRDYVVSRPGPKSGVFLYMSKWATWTLNLQMARSYTRRGANLVCYTMTRQGYADVKYCTKDEAASEAAVQ